MQKRILSGLCALALIVGGLRILQLRGVHLPTLGMLDSWEWIAGLVALAGLALGARLSRRLMLPAFLALAPLLISSWLWPLQTAAVIMVGHNFVPFFYWIKLARTSSRRNVALLSLGLFTAINLFLLAGAFDFIAHQWAWAIPNFGGTLDPIYIALQVFPGSRNFALLERGVEFFAFGQAIHYFLWLKIIPEEAIEQEVPLSFTQSRKEIVRDFGRPLLVFAAALVLAFFALPAMWSLGAARDVYIALVAGHGYLELAGLPLMILNRKPRV